MSAQQQPSVFFKWQSASSAGVPVPYPVDDRASTSVTCTNGHVTLTTWKWDELRAYRLPRETEAGHGTGWTHIGDPPALDGYVESFDQRYSAIVTGDDGCVYCVDWKYNVWHCEGAKAADGAVPRFALRPAGRPVAAGRSRGGRTGATSAGARGGGGGAATVGTGGGFAFTSAPQPPPTGFHFDFSGPSAGGAASESLGSAAAVPPPAPFSFGAPPTAPASASPAFTFSAPVRPPPPSHASAHAPSAAPVTSWSFPSAGAGQAESLSAAFGGLGLASGVGGVEVGAVGVGGSSPDAHGGAVPSDRCAVFDVVKRRLLMIGGLECDDTNAYHLDGGAWRAVPSPALRIPCGLGCAVSTDRGVFYAVRQQLWLLTAERDDWRFCGVLPARDPRMREQCNSQQTAPPVWPDTVLSPPPSAQDAQEALSAAAGDPRWGTRAVASYGAQTCILQALHWDDRENVLIYVTDDGVHMWIGGAAAHTGRWVPVLRYLVKPGFQALHEYQFAAQCVFDATRRRLCCVLPTSRALYVSPALDDVYAALREAGLMPSAPAGAPCGTNSLPTAPYAADPNALRQHSAEELLVQRGGAAVTPAYGLVEAAEGLAAPSPQCMAVVGAMLSAGRGDAAEPPDERLLVCVPVRRYPELHARLPAGGCVLVTHRPGRGDGGSNTTFAASMGVRVFDDEESARLATDIAGLTAAQWDAADMRVVGAEVALPPRHTGPPPGARPVRRYDTEPYCDVPEAVERQLDRLPAGILKFSQSSVIAGYPRGVQQPLGVGAEGAPHGCDVYVGQLDLPGLEGRAYVYVDTRTVPVTGGAVVQVG